MAHVWTSRGDLVGPWRPRRPRWEVRRVGCLCKVVAAVELLAAELDRAAPWLDSDSDQEPRGQTEPEEGETSLVSRVCKLTRPLIASGAASPL